MLAMPHRGFQVLNRSLSSGHKFTSLDPNKISKQHPHTVQNFGK